MIIKTTNTGLTVKFTKREIENLDNPKKYKMKNYYTEMEIWGIPMVLTLAKGELKMQPTPPTAYGFAKPTAVVTEGTEG